MEIPEQGRTEGGSDIGGSREQHVELVLANAPPPLAALDQRCHDAGNVGRDSTVLDIDGVKLIKTGVAELNRKEEEGQLGDAERIAHCQCVQQPHNK